MAKPEWGRKVTCASCSNKFYDMRREPATCPSCGATNDPLQAFRPKRGAVAKPVAQKEAKPKAKVLPEDDEDNDDDELDAVLPDVDDDDDVEDVLDDDEDDDLIEDTADLGEDDDDLDEVREHIETEDPVKE
ncbi:MAG: TIGR02300 family protein [Rhodospirillaceae bacterium]|nr:TIGR02300 family protein [Magnetovibrio sp.]MAY66383.1 TIGR02300 family protein [Rhodospirillaceae bacterium]